MSKSEKLDIAIHFTILGLFLFSIFSGCSALLQVMNRNRHEDLNASKYEIAQKDLSQFRSVMRPHVQGPDSLYRQACYLQDANKHELALRLLEDVILTDPAHVEAYNAMGVSYDYLGDFARAAEAYKRALKLNSSLDYVHNNLGYSYFLQANTDAAIEAFKKAIALDYQNAKYHNNLGLAYGRKKRYELAFEEFKKAGGEAQAHLNLARLLFQQGLYEKAQTHFAAASKDALYLEETRRGQRAAAALAEVTNAQGCEAGEDCYFQAPSIIEMDENGGKRYRFKIDNIVHKRTEMLEAANDVLTSGGLQVIELSQEIEAEKSRAYFEVEVSNGNGVTRMARRVGNYLNSSGLNVTRLTNADHFNFPETKIYYHEDFLQDAFDIAKKIPGYQQMQALDQFGRSDIKVKVLIGRDIIPYDKLFNQTAAES